ncbi:MAG: FkbM family methyltransferase [Pseudomonadota bacterium]
MADGSTPFPERAAAREPSAEQIHQALWAYASAIDAPGLIARASAESGPKPGPEPMQGCLRNFQGALIPVAVSPDILAPLEGTLEGPPAPGNWHGCRAEWGGALHAVAQARGTFTMAELGCGWGPWMLATGIAARARGLAPRLIGVEASARHLTQARQTLALNGFGADQVTLHHAVAGTPDMAATALFPRDPQGGPGNQGTHGTITDWGRAAIFETESAPDTALSATHERLRCLSLAEISAGAPLDLLHLDIQGAELEVVRGNWAEIAARVRRVLIGTHGRALEGALTAHFESQGWRLEVERPALCRLSETGFESGFETGADSGADSGRAEVLIDGVQLWRSPGA